MAERHLETNTILIVLNEIVHLLGTQTNCVTHGCYSKFLERRDQRNKKIYQYLINYYVQLVAKLMHLALV